ncbi:hypothetical protein [Allorhizocola rhizosphaerae]|uniref:hypothetical protein n=1 Tax=Allorhizocola rhizosphaerae TaxID=1872709 RepID=UPI0013C2F854|nr:hypothetical protein [Allorhizocola rhizosphaerae]
MRNTRIVAGVLAIVFALPYVVLKILWTAGVGIGVNDPDLLHQPGMVTANAFTGLLEVVGIATAVALIRPWGMRIPAWLLLFPMWVGTGLLAPFVVMVPVAFGADVFYADAVQTDGALASWVHPMVYGGFALQAIALFVAFAGYARERWANVLNGRTDAVLAGPTHRLQRLLATVVCVMAGASAIIMLAGAFSDTFVQGVAKFVGAAAALSAVAGLLLLVHRVRPGGSHWWAVVLIWLGSAGMFATGGFEVLIAALTLADGDTPATLGGRELLSLFQMLAAIIAGTVAAFALSERDWEARVA